MHWLTVRLVSAIFFSKFFHQCKKIAAKSWTLAFRSTYAQHSYRKRPHIIIETETSSRQCACSCVLPVREGLQTSLAASGNDGQIYSTPTDYQYHRCVPVSICLIYGFKEGRRRQRTEKREQGTPAMPCNLRAGGHHVFRQRQHAKRWRGRRMTTTSQAATWSEVHLFSSLHTKRNALCTFLGSMVKVHACMHAQSRWTPNFMGKNMTYLPFL